MTIDDMRAELLLLLKAKRGHWVKHLPVHLRQALVAINEQDLRLAAVEFIHGSATCSEGNQRPFIRVNEGWQYCKLGCTCINRDNLVKVEATNMAKRGYKNVAQDPAVKAKMEQTCLGRYGVATSGASTARIAKVKNTTVLRYGVDNVFRLPEVKARIKQTTQRKYGVDHASQSAQNQANRRATVLANYGATNVMLVPAIKQKVARTNIQRYGGVAPAACPTVRAKMQQTMLDRFAGHFAQQHIEPQHRITTEEDFRQRFTGRKAAEIAAETGYHPSMIHRTANRWDVALDYSGGSMRDRENEFGDALLRLEVPFRRNARVLPPTEKSHDRRCWKEIDFLFPEHHLGIEFCGAYWHSEANGRDRTYHAAKRKAAAALGIDLIQVFEDEWLDHPFAVLSTIIHRLGLTVERSYARQCTIAELTHAEALAFLDEHHVFGGVAATLHLGLRRVDDQRLVAVMSFIARSKEAREWELSRFAGHGSVIGGASRLLRRFERTQDWTTITSFADLRWSDGDLYPLLGFVADLHLPPDYQYVMGDRRVHKFNLRKTARIFTAYQQEGLTERQMAERAGLTRVYDAGKIRFVKLKPAPLRP